MHRFHNHRHRDPFEVHIAILNHIAGLRLVQTNDRGSPVVNGKVARLPTAAARCHSPPPIHLCSLGTNTVLGNSTNGLFGVLLDDGPEN